MHPKGEHPLEFRIAALAGRQHGVISLPQLRALGVPGSQVKHHGTRVRHRLDADKQARLEAAGLRVLRADWEQVTASETQTADRLRQALD